MSHERTIRSVRDALCSIFGQVDSWFDRADEFRRFKPASGGWSADQVLEHIGLTNHFLMLTLRKYVGIAVQRARRGDPVPDGESDLDSLLSIGERGSFGWVRPDHMEPAGVSSSADVRAQLHRQLGECLILLERVGRGDGALCRVTMTVNALGKIDLYQWLYFIAQHARRHLQQLAAIEAEFADIAGVDLVNRV
jgi:DinB superfamily